MAKPTCIACKGAGGGGVTPEEVQSMINTTVDGYHWELYTGIDWSRFLEDDDTGHYKVMKETVMLYIMYSGTGEAVIIPKGSGSFSSSNPWHYQGDFFYINGAFLFNDSASVSGSLNVRGTTLSESSGVITIDNSFYTMGSVEKKTSYPSGNALSARGVYLYVLRRNAS